MCCPRMMAPAPHRPRKNLQAPIGCEGYLTRRQAAHALGFASEYKIREFERKGMLRSVRGPMRAAFYARPEILTLKAQLALTEPGQVPPEAWSDAELLTLLGHPKRAGGTRTAVDLVMETQISIERAQRVHDFWMGRETGTRPARVAPATLSPPIVPAEPSATDERRSPHRLTHDNLIRNLRDPDPRIRQEAFARLKESDRV